MTLSKASYLIVILWFFKSDFNLFCNFRNQVYSIWYNDPKIIIIIAHLLDRQKQWFLRHLKEGFSVCLIHCYTICLQATGAAVCLLYQSIWKSNIMGLSCNVQKIIIVWWHKSVRLLNGRQFGSSQWEWFMRTTLKRMKRILRFTAFTFHASISFCF